jgi:hypothetical protein
MAGLSSLTEKAKALFHKRGGMDAAKGDMQELKDIHAGEGSMSDKAKAAVDALKDPGVKGPDRAESPGAADAPGGAESPGAAESPGGPDAPDRTPGPERQ